jgi:P-type Cu+ transporter
VIGGCLNQMGSFTLEVTAMGGHTVLAGIVRLMDHAQGSKLPVQKLADRISARFVPAVGGVAAVTFAGWLAAGHPLSRALAHAVAVLLIACPCALGLATPTAIMVGTGQAARRGIYIRNGEALETAARLTTLVFDKTGTITEGRPTVSDFVNLSGLPDPSCWPSWRRWSTPPSTSWRGRSAPYEEEITQRTRRAKEDAKGRTGARTPLCDLCVSFASFAL